MKILFICKANRFRSKVSEAFLNKLKKDPNTEVKSAGMGVDPMHSFVSKNVIDALKEKHAKVENENSKKINSFDIDWADKIIVAANNVSPDLFPKEKTIQWNIKDTDESEMKKIKIIIEDIESHVKTLVNQLKL